MFADNRRSARDSSHDYPFCRKDALIHLSHERRAVNGGDAHGFAASLPGAPPLGEMDFSQVNSTKYVDSFRSFPDTWQLSAIYQDDDLDFVDSRYGGRHDVVFAAWEKRCLEFRSLSGFVSGVRRGGF